MRHRLLAFLGSSWNRQRTTAAYYGDLLARIRMYSDASAIPTHPPLRINQCARRPAAASCLVRLGFSQGDCMRGGCVAGLLRAPRAVLTASVRYRVQIWPSIRATRRCRRRRSRRARAAKSARRPAPSMGRRARTCTSRRRSSVSGWPKAASRSSMSSGRLESKAQHVGAHREPGRVRGHDRRVQGAREAARLGGRGGCRGEARRERGGCSHGGHHGCSRPGSLAPRRRVGPSAPRVDDERRRARRGAWERRCCATSRRG